MRGRASSIRVWTWRKSPLFSIWSLLLISSRSRFTGIYSSISIRLSKLVIKIFFLRADYKIQALSLCDKCISAWQDNIVGFKSGSKSYQTGASYSFLWHHQLLARPLFYKNNFLENCYYQYKNHLASLAWGRDWPTCLSSYFFYLWFKDNTSLKSSLAL